MDEDAFWAIIDDSLDAVGREAEPAMQAQWLSRQLMQRPRNEIESFDLHFWKKMTLLYTWELWGVNTMANGHGGQEAFIGFRAWIVSRGRAAFDNALIDADSLAPLIRKNLQAMELTYITRDAYEETTGTELPTPTLDLLIDPIGEPIKESDLTTRFPKVAAALGL